MFITPKEIAGYTELLPPEEWEPKIMPTYYQGEIEGSFAFPPELEQ